MRRLALLTLATACATSTSMPGPGLHLQLRVAGAQLHRGPIPDDTGGPEVSQVQRPQPQVVRGDADVALNGRLAPDGVALHLQAEGDPDHWVLQAKGFDFVVQDELQWRARFELSHAIQTDVLTVTLAAADADGRMGPATETELTLLPDVPPAVLQVSLGWRAPVDLDLHVMDANGVVIGAKNVAATEPPANGVPEPDAWMEGGFLDYDSNQGCRIDGRQRENVLWLREPPSGTYAVYAHLHSPCGQSAADMEAVVQLRGETLARVGATQYAFDARSHPIAGEPPGLLLTTFEVP